MINGTSLYLAKMLTNMYHKSAMHTKLDTVDIIPTIYNFILLLF